MIIYSDECIINFSCISKIYINEQYNEYVIFVDGFSLYSSKNKEDCIKLLSRISDRIKDEKININNI